jgi:uncharacterized protein (DUF1330 family)
MWQVIDSTGDVVAEFKTYKAARNYVMKRAYATHTIKQQRAKHGEVAC